MKKDFIYIRICDGMNLSKTKIILKDKCNKIVYEEIIVIPLIAKRDEIYCININNNFNKNHLITVLLEDANNSNIKIKRGEILLWEDTLSQ